MDLGGDGKANTQSRPSAPRAKEPIIGATKADLDNLAELVLSLHLGLSVWLHIPEAELTPDESRRLAEAAARVARHYPVVRSQKFADGLNLFMVAGSIYGPRGLSLWLRKNEPAAAQIPPQMPAPGGPPIGANGGAVVQTPGQLDPLAMMGSAQTAGSA